MRIETQRLLLRPFCAQDGRDLWEYMDCDSVVRYSPYVRLTPAQAEAEAAARAEQSELIAIELKAEKKVIGELIYEKGEFDAYEIGFFLNPAYQHRGLAREAAEALLNEAFAAQDVRRLTARCDKRNLDSQHLLERLGFRREGTLLRHIYFKHKPDGTPDWADTCLYGLLAEEWRTIKQGEIDGSSNGI